MLTLIAAGRSGPYIKRSFVVRRALRMLPSRPLLVRRGLWLNYLTLAHNTVEAIVSIAAGVVAGSVALVGFGVDSGIEVTASVAYRFFLRTQGTEM